MKTIWVALLSIVALTLGSCGGLAWRGASSALEGVRIACAVTNTAQSSGVLTQAQLNDMIDRFAKSAGSGDKSGNIDQLVKELKSGCPTFGGKK